MKNLIKILLFALLMINWGCSKYASMSSLPFSFSKYKLDTSLPKITNVSYTSDISKIHLKWERVPLRGVKGYKIYRFFPSKGVFKEIETIYDPDVTNYTDSNLMPGREYSYKIAYFTADGRISPAATIPARTLAPLPPIKNIRVISNLPRKIKIQWDLYPHYSRIEYYAIYRSPNGSSHWEEIDKVKDPMATEYVDYDVLPGRVYFYTVIGYTYDGVPTDNAISNVRKRGENLIVSGYSKPLPKPPINITASKNLPRQIRLAWFDPNNKDRKISYYNVYTSYFKNTLFTKRGRTKGSEKFFIDKINEDGKVVYYKVTAVDADGLESPLPKKSAKGMTKPNPNAPTITEYRVVDGRVILKWLPPEKDVVKYTVLKSYFGPFMIPKIIKYTDITETKFVDKDIQVGKTYRYQVIGYDINGIPSKPSLAIYIKIK